MGGKESNIQESEHWFIGEDRDISMPLVDAAGDPVNMSGMAIRFRLFDRKGGTALVTKTGPTLSDSAGTNDLATVTVTSSDYGSITRGGTYYYQWERTDSGDEEVLAFGRAVLHAGALV